MICSKCTLGEVVPISVDRERFFPVPISTSLVHLSLWLPGAAELTRDREARPILRLPENSNPVAKFK